MIMTGNKSRLVGQIIAPVLFIHCCFTALYSSHYAATCFNESQWWMLWFKLQILSDTMAWLAAIFRHFCQKLRPNMWMFCIILRSDCLVKKMFWSVSLRFTARLPSLYFFLLSSEWDRREARGLNWSWLGMGVVVPGWNIPELNMRLQGKRVPEMF